MIDAWKKWIPLTWNNQAITDYLKSVNDTTLLQTGDKWERTLMSDGALAHERAIELTSKLSEVCGFHTVSIEYHCGYPDDTVTYVVEINATGDASELHMLLYSEDIVDDESFGAVVTLVEEWAASDKKAAKYIRD